MEPTFLRLKSKRARDAYVEAELINSISAQIRVLRQKKGWSQKELAEKLGTSQGVVSRLEDPSYGRFSFKTLLHVASIFDVALLTRFLSFAQLIPATWKTDRDSLSVDSFDEEFNKIRFFNKSSETYVNKYSRSLPSSEMERDRALSNQKVLRIELVEKLKTVEKISIAKS